MSLTKKQCQYLRGLAHRRKPVVLVGSGGMTPAVIAEIDRALEHHELLKIRLPGVEREDRSDMVRAVCEATGAEAVQEIGRMAVLYRRARKPRLALPE